eukprot:TRINITY_DN5122_c2_g1_i4.p1 TRINITY_DN5122_c2_g1~~TRINITY_DN5122_c2_g1_i4.p1  ORF type:complete len:418 (-),score=75.54 TRINITY_DN5122_c2_g1_i4:286-1539(-)
MGVGPNSFLEPAAKKKRLTLVVIGLALILITAVVLLSLWSADVFSSDDDDHDHDHDDRDDDDKYEEERDRESPDDVVQLQSVLQFIQQPNLKSSLEDGEYEDEDVDKLLNILNQDEKEDTQAVEVTEETYSVNLLDLFPVPVNEKYDSVVEDYDRPITTKEIVTTYNNYYEFGTSKSISQNAQKNADYLDWQDWEIEFTGLVAGGPQVLTLGQILANVTVEERLYRHRCVEAWSIAVPWAGFPFSQLLEIVQPLEGARYVKMQTKDFDKGRWSDWLKKQDWPYTEAIALFEAKNDLAFLVVGAYQEPLKAQNGAPIRLALPWKYGFKSVKSIAKIEYTYDRPVNFWQNSNAREYGFWANVNPNISHPRWSQGSERQFIDDIATAKRVPTLYFNGYAEYVQDMYEDLPESDQKILYMK